MKIKLKLFFRKLLNKKMFCNWALIVKKKKKKKITENKKNKKKIL